MKPNHPLTHSEEIMLRKAIFLTIKTALFSLGILVTTLIVMVNIVIHSEEINRFLTSIIP